MDLVLCDRTRMPTQKRFSIHAARCRDLAREQRNNAAELTDYPNSTPAEIIADFAEAGWTKEYFTVYPCCTGQMESSNKRYSIVKREGDVSLAFEVVDWQSPQIDDVLFTGPTHDSAVQFMKANHLEGKKMSLVGRLLRFIESKLTEGFYVMTYGGGRYQSVGWYATRDEAQKEVDRLKMSGAWSGMPPKVEPDNNSRTESLMETNGFDPGYDVYKVDMSKIKGPDPWVKLVRQAIRIGGGFVVSKPDWRMGSQVGIAGSAINAILGLVYVPEEALIPVKNSNEYTVP